MSNKGELKMTIDDAIEELQHFKKIGIKNLVMACWSASLFNVKDDEKWAEMCEEADSTSSIWDGPFDAIEEIVDEKYEGDKIGRLSSFQD